jgi:hypothetical protein
VVDGVGDAIVEEGWAELAGLFEAEEAEVVAPPFEEGEADWGGGAEGAGEEGEVFADELFLEVDGVGGDDGAGRR